MRRIAIGIQLYTVESEVHASPRKAIEAVAKIGYRAIEGGADTYGVPTKEYRKLLDDLGLTLTTVFTSMDEIEKDLRPKIDLARELRVKRIGIPYVDEQRRADAAGWIAVAEQANRAGALCKRHGLELVYHNHSFEFQKFGGRTGFDLFYSHTDPALVRAEIDTYWVQHGGGTPADTIRRYASRVSLLHVKDMLDDADRSFAEVGEGVLDWPAILAAASASKCACLIVEQDVCKRPCLESAALSFRNLTRLMAAAR